jgi:citrate synthase
MPETTTFQRGLEGVVAAQTRLSHVDGLAGELTIGGYELKELAGKVAFGEAAHLLWKGHLPNAEELAAQRKTMAKYRAIPETTMTVVKAAAAAKASPIDTLRMAAATLAIDLSNPDAIDHDTEVDRAMMLTARFPTIIAAHTRLMAGQPVIPPREDLTLAGNFLYMVHGREPDPIAAKALDTYWVTVMDHGMNASTFTARVIASTRSDMVSAVTGAIGALKGPLHGGAPGPVLDMLVDIGSLDNAEKWLKNEIAQGRRIMGFGHRVYKVRDPRAEVLSAAAEEMTGARLENRKLFDLALEVEKIAIRVLDEAKPGRNLRTNVEFYTALVLQGIGLQPKTFVAMFACGRVAGWCAHVIEQHAEDHLIRPKSEYIGQKGLKVDRK